ncbi:MAG TPA: HAD family phosphatase [Thermotogota bacterium]|nr:HAD family phosphatase [Thermotogota bacterium]HPJ89446.1 HAD family phosphatase [Thermotogota bacterium]HPR95271.1 HAD family phosphatase [Thermotogota bacterium]
MIRGIIFDMDGVLIDSEPMYREVNRGMFEKLGFSISEEEYSEFVGTTDVDMWTTLKNRFGIKKSIAELNEIREGEHMTFFSEAELVPMTGIGELLTFLNKKGLRLAVASSTDEKLVHLILEKIGIRDLFDPIVCGNQIEKGKPEPDIFLKAAELSGLRPEECLVIEDSKNGVTAGKKAGMTVVGFQSDDGTQNISHADIVIHSLKDAQKYIGEIL